jgi:Protein of unknown function (DUF2997)
MHQIIIRVTPKGETTVKAEGFQGPSCSTVTRPFIEGLGRVVEDTPTPEMWQQATQGQEVRQ